MTGDVTTEWIGIFGEDACRYGKPDSHTRLDPKPRPLGDLLWAIGFRRPLTLLLTSILGLFNVDTSAQSIENLVSKEMDVVTSILWHTVLILCFKMDVLC